MGNNEKRLVDLVADMEEDDALAFSRKYIRV